MRNVPLLRAGAVLLLAAGLAHASAPNTESAFDIDAATAEKLATDRGGGIPNPIYVNVGGDTIGSATPIASLPFADTGNTCQFTHQYDAVCPYSLPGAPDVVYSFAPSVNVNTSVSLCTSSYDTKVYVYENAVGNLVACNDDVCGSDGFKSEIEAVNLTAGNTYYIVVDGWQSVDCGNYVLTIEQIPDCIVDCPPGAYLEGEPNCQDNALDHYNGGCNSTPPVFTTVHCTNGPPVTICCTYGGFTYFGSSYRDTDWYRVPLVATSSLSFCVTGEYDTLIGIIDPATGCPVSTFFDYALGGPCVETCLNQTLTYGEWWFFVATSGFGPTAGACGGNYTMTISNAEIECGGISVEPSSWGSIKNLYR